MRRNRAELFIGPPAGTSWCSGHQAWLPIEQFARYGSKGLQGYCRTCHAEYMRQWRRNGLPAKRRQAYAREQTKPSGLAALAAKYANR